MEISIIVPVYNCEQYIDKCLNSLVKQTCSNIEILVINDGSTDKTSEIINRYAKEYSNLYVFHCKNQGVSAARNFGLSKAVGMYIGFVDADDFIDSNMYAKMLEMFRRYNTDWIECGYYKVYKGLPFCEQIPKFETALCYKDYFSEFCLAYIMQEPVIWNKLFKRSIIADHNISFALGASEDLVFCLEYALYSNTISCINEALYYYVQRENSIMHSCNNNVLILEIWLEQFLKRICSNKMYENRAGSVIYEYIYAKIIVGILFSECAARCSISELVFLVKKIKSWDGFSKYCSDIVQGRLNFLKEKRIVSQTVLFLLMDIAVCCKMSCFLLAAIQVWIFSRINYLRELTYKSWGKTM